MLNQPLVLDAGRATLRFGISGEPAPSTKINSYVARPKHDRVMIGSLEGNSFIGPEAEEHRGLMRLTHPIQNGVIKDWDDMELLWQYVYKRLSSSSEEHPLLVTEPPLNPLQNREKSAELLFENFNVPALYFGIPAVLALYASGKTTGLTIDVGDSVSHCVPVYHGFAVKSAIMRSDLAGNSVTDFLQLLLRKQSLKLVTTSELEIVKEIKERHSFALPELDSNMVRNITTKTKYKLPDGQKIELQDLNLSRAAEIMFRPHIYGSEERSVQELLFDSVSRSDTDLRSSLYQNILLSGGGSMLTNMGDRLINELKLMAPPSTKLRIFAPPNRDVSSWIGGSILANLSSFKKMWMTAEQYAEDGYRIHSQ